MPWPDECSGRRVSHAAKRLSCLGQFTKQDHSGLGVACQWRINGVATQVRIAGQVDALIQEILAVVQAQVVELGEVIRRKFVSEIIMGAEWGLAAECGEDEET